MKNKSIKFKKKSLTFKEKHFYYNKKEDYFLYVSKWTLDGVSSLCAEKFFRKENQDFPTAYKDKGIIAYEADESLTPINEIDTIKSNFIDKGVEGIFAELSTLLGGGSSTEVDIIVPRYSELKRKMKACKTIKQFAKLATTYVDVIYSKQGIRGGKNDKLG